METNTNEKSENVYSVVVKAGKKTYFIDLKANDRGLCLIIKESRKRFNEDGTVFFQKNRLVIWPEDINRVHKAICNGVDQMKKWIKKEDPDFDFGKYERRDEQWDAEDSQA